MDRKCKISVTSMLSARRKSPVLFREGRDRGFPRINHDDLCNIMNLETDLVLAKMTNMTAEEAAAVAALAVAEAEAAMAEAEEAMREAEAAEADAEAAVAALEALRGGKVRERMPCSMKSGTRVSQLEPESD